MRGSKGLSNPISYIAILNKMSHLQFISTHDGQIKIITYVNPITICNYHSITLQLRGWIQVESKHTK
jgi:hypothetical protein